VGAHRHVLKVRFAELDPYNHVNHAVYVTYFEAGRTEALESVGLGLHVMAELGWQVVVADLAVTFRSSAKAGDTLVVITEIAELGAVVGVWHQQIRMLEADGTDGALVCEARVRAGSVGPDGRPKRISPEILERLRMLAAAGE
jgi:YbgC/YbaW family acyl-CoA thioester hydrolase